MKHLYQIAVFVSLAALFFSCDQSDEIKVNLLGEVRTRRTFADIQFIDDEKERNNYIDRQEKSNPQVYDNFSAADSLLITQFERIGLVKNNEFIQSAFKPQTQQTTTFTDNQKRTFKLEFFTDSLSGHTHFRISSSRTTVNMDIQADPLQELNYVFLDVIPGGNKELVFLDDYYIMNGFNFDLKYMKLKHGNSYHIS